MFIQTSAAVCYKARSTSHRISCRERHVEFTQNATLIRIMVALLYSTKYIPKNFSSKTLDYVSSTEYLQIIFSCN